MAMNIPDRNRNTFKAIFLPCLVVLALIPGSVSAQVGRPTGARGGILVPGAETLKKGALSFGVYSTFNRLGLTNTLLGNGSVGYGLNDYIQVYGSFAGYLVGTGDSPIAFESSSLGWAAGPIGVTLRWPGPAERAFQLAVSASVTPGVNSDVLSGHNHPYARDSFDIALSVNQSLRVGAFDLRAVEGIVVTDAATGTNIPTHAVLGLGVSWWVMPTVGLEFEMLSRLETEVPIEPFSDYLAASGGAVVNLGRRWNIRGGYMIGFSDPRTDGIGTRAEDWMAYGSVEIILGSLVERPEREARVRAQRPVSTGVTDSDSDGDGVPDSRDLEPLTPEGAVVDESGRAIDTDGDGVPDGLDMEPDTPSGATVDAMGRSNDTDGDGVADGIDLEADTPSGALVDSVGRALDGDGDGVPDGIDVEPNTPQGIPVDSMGRGLYGMEAELITKGLLTLNAIYFESGSANIKPESYQTLLEVGMILAKYTELKIEVSGHTDNTGSETLNQELSQARAESVLNWILVNTLELSLSQFTIRGYGELQPIASNDTVEGRTLNRRVEFKVLNPAELDKYRRPPD